MDLRNQGEQPVARPVASHSSAASDSGMLSRLLIILATILAVCALIFVILRTVNIVMANSAVHHNEYQALFLSNGQVYFGHLSNVDGDYVKLTDIFYLQVQQSVQPSTSSSSNSNQQVSLAKLGSELHAPEDQMLVARDQVLFWENLKSSGKVVTAITAYNKAHPGTN